MTYIVDTSLTQPPKAHLVVSKDPNVVNSQEEQDDIAKGQLSTTHPPTAHIYFDFNNFNNNISCIFPHVHLYLFY